MAPFRWPKPEHDKMLCYEFINRKPSKPEDWAALAHTLCDLFSSKENKIIMTGRSCRDHLLLLVKKYKTKDQKALKRSGTEEELSELNELLEDISCYLQDLDENPPTCSTKKQKQEEDLKRGLLMRKAAMETYTRKHDVDDDDDDDEEEDEDEDDELSDEGSLVTSSKKLKKSPQKAHRKVKATRCGKGQMLEYLAKKHRDTMQLKKKKLELEERKIALEEIKMQIEQQKWQAVASKQS